MQKKKSHNFAGTDFFFFCLPVLLNAKVALILSSRASSGEVGALMHTDVEI